MILAMQIFKKQLWSKFNILEPNPELIDVASSVGGASLGKFSEGSSEKENQMKQLN